MTKKDFYKQPKGFTYGNDGDTIRCKKYRKSRFIKAKKRFLTRVWRKDWNGEYKIKYEDFMKFFGLRAEEP